jgi:hypothetical protein
MSQLVSSYDDSGELPRSSSLVRTFLGVLERTRGKDVSAASDGSFVVPPRHAIAKYERERSPCQEIWIRVQRREYPLIEQN